MLKFRMQAFPHHIVDAIPLKERQFLMQLIRKIHFPVLDTKFMLRWYTFSRDSSTTFPVVRVHHPNYSTITDLPQKASTSEKKCLAEKNPCLQYLNEQFCVTAKWLNISEKH